MSVSDLLGPSTAMPANNGESEYVVAGSDSGFTDYMPSYIYRGSVFVYLRLKQEIVTELWS